jgi:AcrR family transcriptional regulator
MYAISKFPLYTHDMSIFMRPDSQWHTKSAYKRRAGIRAIVRQRLAKYGYNGIHVKDIARSSKVSIQTLYNNFGGRDDIVSSSITELVSVQLKHVEYKSLATNRNFVMVSGDQLIELIDRDKVFVCALYGTLKSLNYTHPVVQNLRNILNQAYVEQLELMRNRGSLRKWVDTRNLANSILNANDSVMLNFVHMDPSGIAEHLRFAIGMPLLAASTGHEAEQLEKELMV